MSKLAKNEAIAKLQKLITSIETLKGIVRYSPEFKKWRRDAQVAIAYIFGEGSRHTKDFESIHYSLGAYSDSTPDSKFQEAYVKGLDNAKAILQSMIDEIQEYWKEEQIDATNLVTNSIPSPCVFIGHGRSKLWARLKTFLNDDLRLTAVAYESESRVSESIVSVLEQMLNQAAFAVLILTAEDETTDGLKRARQNVIHEAGLFQGRLGFRKAVLLRQEGLEDFTNVAGLQYISFSGDQIEQTFYELQRVLKREGLL
jgi:predicted nucleotide-binding protein